MSSDSCDPLSEIKREILRIIWLQLNALSSAVFVGMTSEQTNEYDMCHDQIAKLFEEAAVLERSQLKMPKKLAAECNGGPTPAGRFECYRLPLEGRSESSAFVCFFFEDVVSSPNKRSFSRRFKITISSLRRRSLRSRSRGK